MELLYEEDGILIIHGDCREVLPQIGPVDAIVTDPPYGLEFMGKGWDRGVPGVEFWQAALSALAPGGHLLAFGGTRTFHRLACAIEDAGFEMRDCLMWLYGSGFPKSLDISKAIDKRAGEERGIVGDGRWAGREGPKEAGTLGAYSGAPRLETAPVTVAAKLWSGWGTALKPAWEPIILAMKPTDGTFAENAQKHGVAGLNVDDGRIATEEDRSRPPRTPNKIFGGGAGTNLTASESNSLGRFPANLILDEEAARLLDEQSGKSTSRIGKPRASEEPGDGWGMTKTGTEHNDSGGASRFFYCAKTSRSERGEGNDHPTVKPLSLMKYLLTLLSTPTGGLVVDPFMGSGSTLVAAKHLGRPAIGIDLDRHYCDVAIGRIKATSSEPQ